MLFALPDGGSPQVAEDAWVAPGAHVVGDVTLHPGASVWYGAVVRADNAPIVIGRDSNLQDNVSAHVDPAFPLTVGERVSVGHNAVLHGCTIEDDVLIGMSATILNGARIGTGSLVAAGAVVTQGADIPPRSLVAGVPAKVRRELTDDELRGIAQNAAVYLEKTRQHREAVALD
ncbi:Carbonic anhydrase or acetyltransferase, isoleucine patch superfamily [Leifsonia sp. 98AMF]|uniref:gamma carbonic anhydrase family protein n=1 Tax=unclassified Leifsonia TaxID=2663824 RepID=UPI00087C2DC5|nr:MULTISPECIES: gamma carbonic anhydrase family protein [unclassified Leifsonia]SDH67546.1 Carbonic anhydrase or acetyltransferase, isoleucine patch superfamily [Leifsonia sp. 197AMF]SDI72146.1 Carbonic anhydrase or acetyltransferase, isoleucine patch superfamily [Leifsonia sp. 466MF]SDK17214.1 Carbonic anhydrase or acetyltransferase, isoleucine patch superfamily [Leifsonia sp. 157MF]SDN74939.1 Carbonic anhydrase or acetyltransferase, isoleucine patch superfamily [Leifsonia sp. 509MF]SEN33275